MTRQLALGLLVVCGACRQLTPAEQAVQAQKDLDQQIWEKCQKPIYGHGRYGMTAFDLVQLQQKAEPRWSVYRKCLKDNGLTVNAYALGLPPQKTTP